MDKLTRYRTLIKQALTERANLMRSQPLPGEEVVCVLDEATDNYLLLRLGWVRGKRLYSVTLHLRLVHGKVHVEQDWTDDFMSDLVAAGVSYEDIVFALTTPPELRPQTDYVAV
jgi:hypothetical protein